jgi:hypothetical protein
MREVFLPASAVLARITLGKVVGAFLPLGLRAGMMQALPVWGKHFGRRLYAA